MRTKEIDIRKNNVLILLIFVCLFRFPNNNNNNNVNNCVKHSSLSLAKHSVFIICMISYVRLVKHIHIHRYKHTGTYLSHYKEEIMHRLDSLKGDIKK